MMIRSYIYEMCVSSSGRSCLIFLVMCYVFINGMLLTVRGTVDILCPIFSTGDCTCFVCTVRICDIYGGSKISYDNTTNCCHNNLLMDDILYDYEIKHTCVHVHSLQ